MADWSTYLDLFLQHLRLERGLAENSLAAYKSDLCQFAGAARNTDPLKVSSQQINRFFGDLIEAGARPTTIARKIAAVKQFFSHLEATALVSESPAKGYRAPKIARYHPDYLSAQEVAEIIDAAAADERFGLRDRAIVELLYGSGLRLSELLALKLADVEFEAGFIRVTGKGGKQRLVPLGRYSAEALEGYLQQRDTVPIESTIFANRHGKPFSRAGIWKRMKLAVKRAGISKRVTPHTFRHSFATHLLEGGADLRVVQEMLGHADISTTEIYTQIDREYILAEHRKHHPRELAGFRGAKQSD